MFLKRRKSDELSVKKVSLQEGDVIESGELGQEAAPAGDTLVTEIAEMGDRVNQRAKDLEMTEVELRDLARSAENAEGDEVQLQDVFQTNQPRSEPASSPGEESSGGGEDLSSVFGKGDEEEKEEKDEEEEKDEDLNDSLSNLFDQEEEEVNPLLGLVASLPDVTAQALLDELLEVKEIMRER